jgi:hypothetical protein
VLADVVKAHDLGHFRNTECPFRAQLLQPCYLASGGAAEHIGGSARAYLARIIGFRAFLPSRFPRQGDVRGPHIYPEHAMQRMLGHAAGRVNLRLWRSLELQTVLGDCGSVWL